MLRLSAFLLVFCSFFSIAEVVVSDATIRLLPPGTPNTSAYFTVKNTGEKDVYLVGAQSEVAKTVELHNHVMKGEVMRMEKQEKVKVAAGETVTFQPGGLHIMLFGLKSPLSENQHVEIGLNTQEGGVVTFSAKAARPGAHSHHGHH